MLAPNLLLIGLVLVPISFGFPRASLLHGGGGASLGLAMLIVAVWNSCKWADALLCLVTTATCISGSFWYPYDHHAGFVLSMVGAVAVRPDRSELRLFQIANA